MIEYVIAENPDDRVLKKAFDYLKNGKLICFPSDTNWIVACDPANKDAVTKLYRLKDEGPHKHFSLLCNSISMASDLAKIGDGAFKVLNKLTPGHYTFIFEATKKMAKTLKASKKDKEVGIRIIPNTLVNRLIETCGSALLSSNLTEKQLEQNPPFYSYMIEDALSNELSMIIDPGEFEFVGKSTIISFINGEAELIREGVGPF